MNETTSKLYDYLKTILASLEPKYSLKAIEIADIAHRGQKRKFQDEDYINHPIRVARNALLSPCYFGSLDKECTTKRLKIIDEEISIAVCHDVFEDTKTTFEDVIGFFTPYILKGFIALTRTQSESYFDFIMRIKETPYSLIKIWDLEDNMSDLKEGSLKDKYRLARYILKINNQEAML